MNEEREKMLRGQHEWWLYQDTVFVPGLSHHGVVVVSMILHGENKMIVNLQINATLSVKH